MEGKSAGRYAVVVERGAPRGDLYELEQTDVYRVVDLASDRVIMTFESKMEASLSTTTGLWDDYQFSGVADVRMAPDGQSVIVTRQDGAEDMVPLSEAADAEPGGDGPAEDW